MRRGSSAVAVARPSAKQRSHWPARARGRRQQPTTPPRKPSATTSSADARHRPSPRSWPGRHSAPRRERRVWGSEPSGAGSPTMQDSRRPIERPAPKPCDRARLQAAAAEAVDTLRELMRLRKRPDIRSRAALGILATAAKAEELENLAARIGLGKSSGTSGELAVAEGGR